MHHIIFTPPFRYVEEGDIIVDAQNVRVLDIRGWGHLTGQSSLGMDHAAAIEATKEFGRFCVESMNRQSVEDEAVSILERLLDEPDGTLIQEEARQFLDELIPIQGETE